MASNLAAQKPLQFFRSFKDNVNVVVCEDRAFAIPNILQEYPETNLILMDDSFQHRSVNPQLNILLTEYASPFYKDYVLPFGKLREARLGASRADIIVVTKCDANIPVLEIPGFEADDVAGTVAKRAEANGFQVYLMTMDKDYCQLITENVFLYKPSSFGPGYETYGVQRVLEKFGIEKVSQVIDILGLMGDSVDNIPGVSGVNPKTATDLLKRFRSIEELLRKTPEIKAEKLRFELQNSHEALQKTRAMIRLRDDFEGGLGLEELKPRASDPLRLAALYEGWGFRGLRAGLGWDLQTRPQ